MNSRIFYFHNIFFFYVLDKINIGHALVFDIPYLKDCFFLQAKHAHDYSTFRANKEKGTLSVFKLRRLKFVRSCYKLMIRMRVYMTNSTWDIFLHAYSVMSCCWTYIIVRPPSNCNKNFYNEQKLSTRHHFHGQEFIHGLIHILNESSNKWGSWTMSFLHFQPLCQL